MLRLLVLMFALLLLPYAAVAQNSPAGAYVVTGIDSDGKSYTGELLIVPQGEAWNLTWNIDGDKFSGIGILRNDVFAVAYMSERKLGVNHMTATPTGFEGKYTERADRKTYSEAWTRK